MRLTEVLPVNNLHNWNLFLVTENSMGMSGVSLT